MTASIASCAPPSRTTPAAAARQRGDDSAPPRAHEQIQPGAEPTQDDGAAYAAYNHAEPAISAQKRAALGLRDVHEGHDQYRYPDLLPE